MATIQIRDIPEEAYEVIRRRARAENRSIQSYMLQHVLTFASRPTKAEIFAEWDRRARERGHALNLTPADTLRYLDEGRHERDRLLIPDPDADS